MRTRIASGIAGALLTAWVPMASRAATIDTFETPDSIIGPAFVGGTAFSQVVNPPGAIAGTRVVSVGGSIPAFSALTQIGSGSLSYQQTTDTATQAFGGVVWVLSQPVDLTEGGALSAFALTISFAGLDMDVSVSLISPCAVAGCSLAESTIRVPVDGSGLYRFEFDDFARSTTGASHAADLTAVERIALIFHVGPNPGGHSVVVDGPFVTVPEPSTMFGGLAAAALLLARATRRA